MTNADIVRMDAAIHDCWNQIGIRGDQSCERLKAYIHCRNCSVYAQAASDLLDRITVEPADSVDVGAITDTVALNGSHAQLGRMTVAGPGTAELVQENGRALAQEAFLLFRVAEEWFALPARFIAQVANASAVHSLPRVRSKAVLGLTNVRGQLSVCVSLSRLLDLPELPDLAERPSAQSQRASTMAVAKRFIVTRDAETSPGRERRGEEITVFPVDEVHGIERFARSEHRMVPATLAHANGAHTRSLLTWQARTVGVLDGPLLFETLRRSLG